VVRIGLRPGPERDLTGLDLSLYIFWAGSILKLGPVFSPNLTKVKTTVCNRLDKVISW